MMYKSQKLTNHQILVEIQKNNLSVTLKISPLGYKFTQKTLIVGNVMYFGT